MPELADRLVESVPNVSEGRRLDTVERLADAISAVPEVHLLDQTSDSSHNRSVFTLAGPAGAVSDALERLVGAAIDEIDMNEHSGEHPRIGAVDVIPFVPLGDTSMDETVEIATAFGERIAARFDLPVYLYAEAAQARRAGEARRRQARPVRGPQVGDLAARPRAGLRPAPDASVGRCGRGRCASVPHRLQHQPRIARQGTGRSGSPAGSGSPAAACRRSRPTASSSRSWGGPRSR